MGDSLNTPQRQTGLMVANDGAIYRFVIDGPVSSSFRSAFPGLAPEITDSGYTILVGPVADPSELAGIVSDICYRNTCIVRLEVVDASRES